VERKSIIVIIIFSLIIFSASVFASLSWQSDSNIASGLTAMNYGHASAFYKDSTYYLITSGQKSGFDGDGWFKGYNWTGSAWQSDTAIISGLPTDTAFNEMYWSTVFKKGSTWYTILGRLTGEVYGYNWSGSTWQSDSSIISGLPSDFGSYVVPDVFYKDETYYLIAGTFDGDWYGYDWTGSTWHENSTIISGLPNIGNNTTPSVFYADDTWYLISGNGSSSFSGFNWSGSQWQNDTEIVDGLSSIGGGSVYPEVFELSSNWYFIGGGWSFGGPVTFVGYNLTGLSASNTCTCPSVNTSWQVNMSDSCNLTTSCNLGTGNLTFVGAGQFNCSAQLNLTTRSAPSNNSIFYFSDGCEIIRQ